MSPVLLLHLALCLYLAGSVFGRARLMGDHVRRDVRLVFCALGLVAIAGLALPISAAWAPDGWSTALLASISAVQRITSQHWRHGVPAHFCRPIYCRRPHPQEPQQ